MNLIRPTYAKINLDHLEHNFHFLGQFISQASGLKDLFYCPMVKANAYGHGDISVATKLQDIGAHYLGVGLIEEGIYLRKNGIKIPLVFFGKYLTQDLPDIFNYKLTPVISDWQQLKETADWVCEHITDFHANAFKIHIKFDTGMHRLGFELSQASAVSEFLKQNSQLWLEGVLTHLHSAEDLQCDDNQSTSFNQLKKFQDIQPFFTRWTPYFHALNSAGLFNFYQMKFQSANLTALGIRPGLSLYGVQPNGTNKTSVSGLKPVMSLVSKVVHLVKVPKGETVSYGGTWKAEKESWVGVIPMGYADGYHRALSNKAEVLIQGKRFKQVGQICMDYFMIDVTPIAATESDRVHLLQQEVILLNEDIDAWELANKSQTIAWEILTSIGERVPRKVFNEGR